MRGPVLGRAHARTDCVRLSVRLSPDLIGAFGSNATGPGDHALKPRLIPGPRAIARYLPSRPLAIRLVTVFPTTVQWPSSPTRMRRRESSAKCSVRVRTRSANRSVQSVLARDRPRSVLDTLGATRANFRPITSPRKRAVSNKRYACFRKRLCESRTRYGFFGRGFFKYSFSNRKSGERRATGEEGDRRR